MLEEHIAKLVDKSEALKSVPSADELLEWKAQFESRISGQSETLKAEKLRETERYMDKILAGKRKKLVKQGQLDKGWLKVMVVDFETHKECIFQLLP